MYRDESYRPTFSKARNDLGFFSLRIILENELAAECDSTGHLGTMQFWRRKVVVRQSGDNYLVNLIHEEIKYLVTFDHHIGVVTMQLISEQSCREFLAGQPPSVIAQQLSRDKAACQNSRLPSILVHYLPSSNTVHANEIALALFPGTKAFPRAIRMAQYNGLVTILKSSLQNMGTPSKHEPLPYPPTSLSIPTRQDFRVALEVLEFCSKSEDQPISMRMPLEDVLRILKDKVEGNIVATEGLTETVKPPTTSRSRQKVCYICQYLLLTHHPQYPSLCRPCGDYNLSSSALSLPDALHLEGKTALVTGGRLNLGFRTALRLLRCGAKVIVSTRYPRDAEVRYMQETDHLKWRDHLHVIGADFRAANDVFQLVHLTKGVLEGWHGGRNAKLDILINNAAQTLTDSVKKEDSAVQRESKLRLESPFPGNELLLAKDSYTPRIRGGVHYSKSLTSTSVHYLESTPKDINRASNQTSGTDSAGSEDCSLRQNDPNLKSSWSQSLHEVPYEDVISAHSVNTFVPLILLRELLPCMGIPKTDLVSTERTSKPAAYVINVTSREGIFESSPQSSAKNGKHVHTNLTKAALNMLTETEAAPAWRERRVAINSVDPGFMSAAPEVEERWKQREGKEWQCPIGWEDGAGRVLWPIAVSESGDGAVWGRFLKHFGSVEIDVGVGR